jgi:DNA polymerase
VPPLVLVVGEAPGAEEDASGRPFVGPAGCLLDDMLAAIGLSRLRNCFIANVVKCRPPNNRLPTQDETAACLPFLCRQIAALRPRVILAAGRVAAHNLLGIEETMGRLRGTLYPYRLPPAFAGGAPSTEIPLIATYHPSALLRDPGLKRPAFDDLKFLMAHLASLDPVYRAEAQPLINKYAAKDSRLAPLAE